MLTLLTLLLLTACFQKNDSSKDSSNNEGLDEVIDLEFGNINLEVESNKSDYMTETGGVKIGKDGAVKKADKLSVPVVVDFFFDPVCLSCSKYNDVVGETMKNKINAEEIGVIFHPVPYLNDKSPDDYSNRASAYILSVAEYAPDKVLPFIQIVLSEKFRPENPADNSTSDNKFIEAMESAKLSGDEIDKVEFNKDSFVSIAIAAGKEFSSDNSKWLKYSSVKDDNGEKVIFTPFILINKSGSYESNSLPLEGDLIKEFEDIISNTFK